METLNIIPQNIKMTFSNAELDLNESEALRVKKEPKKIQARPSEARKSMRNSTDFFNNISSRASRASKK